jgi:hypothetical protein
MKVWLACFLVLFALAELFDWVKDLSLPLPIYILGGAFLAVASNYNRLIGSYWNTETELNQKLADIQIQPNPGIDLEQSTESMLKKPEIAQ